VTVKTFSIHTKYIHFK